MVIVMLQPGAVDPWQYLAWMLEQPRPSSPVGVSTALHRMEQSGLITSQASVKLQETDRPHPNEDLVPLVDLGQWPPLSLLVDSTEDPPPWNHRNACYHLCVIWCPRCCDHWWHIHAFCLSDNTASHQATSEHTAVLLSKININTIYCMLSVISCLSAKAFCDT